MDDNTQPAQPNNLNDYEDSLQGTRDDPERTPTLFPRSTTEPPQAHPQPEISISDLTARHRPPVKDLDATRIQRSSIPGQTQLPPPDWKPLRERKTRQTPIPAIKKHPSPPPPSRPPRNWWGCFSRIVLVTTLVAAVLFITGLAGASIGYVLIAGELPPPGELTARVSDFETSYILDSAGNLLYELIPSDAGRRQRIPLDKVSPLLVQATIATEDRNFYLHPGFDPIGIARAIVQNLIERDIVSGASTITQQLARNLFLTPEERTQETAKRKIREIILAAEITRRYSKDTILEIYLNELNYGNLAYGIEAASQTYFQKSAADLNLAEASFLAGLAQAPAAWDPYLAPDLALGRHGQVLSLMVESGYIDQMQAQQAAKEMAERIESLIPPHVDMVHPHFVNYTRQELEALLGPQNAYRQGIRVFTTLDPVLQSSAEGVIDDHRPHLSNWGADNAMLVAINPGNGHILAMVGSADFDDETISGQINMALVARQPGSSIKPLTYVTAFEKDWTPGSLIWDVPTTFVDEWDQAYTPKNFDNNFHGPTLLRDALANSLNIPAVKALNAVGVCDFIQRSQEVGFVSLQDEGCATLQSPRDFGLALTLGGGEVTPLEMVSLYATLANNGNRYPTVAIERIEDLKGNVIYQHVPEAQQVIRSEHAYLINNILSDDEARLPAYGLGNRLDVPDRSVAVKTGTSGTDENDVRDGWTIGYTPRIAVGVWTGNTNNAPMSQGASGYRVASPIWRAFLDQALEGQPATDFPQPSGIVEMEICADSGTQPSADCPQERRKMELFVHDQPPLPADEDIYRRIRVDLWTGLEANNYCPEAMEENLYVVIEDKGGRLWVEETAAGRQWAAERGITLEEVPGDPSPRLRLPPSEACTDDTPRPTVLLTAPNEGQTVTGELIFYGTVTAPGISGFQIEYGFGLEPQGWGIIKDRTAGPVEANELARWDTRKVRDGDVTVRISIFGPSRNDGREIQFEQRVHIQLINPTNTPTRTPTPTATPTMTPTPLPTETELPTDTPSPTMTSTPVPAVTPTPSSTVPAEESPTPEVIATEAPLPTASAPTLTPADTITPESG